MPLDFRKPCDCSQPIVIGEREFSILDSPPFVYCWPVGVAFAAKIAAERPQLGRLADVGCGTGLAGIVAAPFATSLIQIDSNERACSVARHNAKTHGVETIALPLEWDKVHIPFDSIIGSEIVCVPHDLRGLAKFIARNWTRRGSCWIANRRDPAGQKFEEALADQSLKFRKSIEQFDGFPWVLWEVQP